MKGDDFVGQLGTYSFISKTVKEELKLLVMLTRFSLTLGDERKIRGGGKCN